MIYNCSCLAADLGKIFEAYWFLGDSQSVPSPWPDRFATLYNKDTPLQLPLNNTPSMVYLSVRSLLFYGPKCMKSAPGVFLLLVHYTQIKILTSVSYFLRVPLRLSVQLAGLRTSSPSSASWRMPRASFTSL